MNLLWTSPLGPVAWLLAGTGLLLAMPHSWAPRARVWLLRLCGWAGALAWLALRFQPQQAPMLWQWRVPLGIETIFGLQLDPWAWWVGLGIITTLAMATALPGIAGDDGVARGSAWAPALTAAALLVVMAFSWMNLLMAWALMWLLAGALAPASAQARVWSAGILATAFLWMTALWDPSALVWQLIPGTALNPLPQLLLVLAISISLGIYPLHVAGRGSKTAGLGATLLLYLVPALAALHLLGQFSLPLLTVSSWLFLLVVALLGTALAAFTEEDARRSWYSILLNRSAWVLFMAALIATSPPYHLLLPLITLFLGTILWAFARLAEERHAWRWPHWLAFAVLYGLPFTPAFHTIGFWHRLTNSVVGIPLWLLMLLAQSVLVAAFLRPALPSPRRLPRPPWFLSWGITLLGALALWWGLFPASLARWGVGLAPDAGTPLFWTPLSSIVAIDWLTLFLPLIAGAGLAWLQRRSGQPRLKVALIARLDWLFGIGERLLHGLSVWLGILADVLDGAGQFGWALLALLTAIILLRS